MIRENERQSRGWPVESDFFTPLHRLLARPTLTKLSAAQAKPNRASFERLFLYLGRENPDDNCKGTQSMLVKHCVCSLVGQYFARKFLVLFCSSVSNIVFCCEAVTRVVPQRLRDVNSSDNDYQLTKSDVAF